MTEPTPHEADVITAVVATRNRGASAAITVRSLLGSDHPSFGVIVVDQSDDDRTEDALAEFRADERFRYVRSRAIGVARAQNLAASMCDARYLAFTDDDCEVPVNWLTTLVRVFDGHPNVAVAYTNVVPGPHDASAGFVPAYVRTRDGVARSVLGKVRKRGIGAGMAARRTCFLEMGGFDEAMGPGAVIPSAADRDLAIRAVLRGWEVYETADVAVVHHGFRTWEQGRELTERNWTGLGAMCAKPVRAGHPATLVFTAYELVVNAFLHPMSRLLTGHRPQGLRRIVYFAKGFGIGWRTPIDRDRLLFDP